jgi:hypothetical protein
MGHTTMAGKRKSLGKTIGFGLLTCGCYAALFLNADMVMQYFTRGAWYAALPVGTALLFSFVHGAFASNLWSTLGIEATRKTVQPQPEKRKRPALRKRARVQPRLSV